MKKLFKDILVYSLLAFAFAFCGVSTSSAQTTTLPNINQGQFSLFGSNTMAVRDSISTSETKAYIIPVTHINDLNLYGNFSWTKIGAGTATLTFTFSQSNDGVNFYTLPKGAANTAYTKVLTLSATAANELNLTADSVKFSGRYLKVQLATSATASVKGKYWGLIKTNIK